jgi:ribose 5-phosphate isomerase B
MAPLNTVLIASDHAGVELKAALQKELSEWSWQDLGPLNLKPGERVDYPDFAAAVAEKISKGEATLGILICGSGVGMVISANKFKHVRATLAENPVVAQLSREHNDANVLCLGARFLATPYAADISRAFLTGKFSSEGRHHARVEKIGKLET